MPKKKKQEKKTRKLGWGWIVILVLAVIVSARWMRSDPGQRQFQENPGFNRHPESQALVSAIRQARSEYPVEEIRHQFVAICEKIDRGEYEFSIDPSLHGRGLVFTSYEFGKPAIVFVKPQLKILLDMYAGKDEVFMDFIVQAILHEDYHLRNHGHATEKSQDELRQDESEAWWWICNEIVPQMRANGRLYPLVTSSSLFYAIRCHALSNGDPKHEAWTTFVRFISNDQQVTEEELLNLMDGKKPAYGPQPR